MHVCGILKEYYGALQREEKQINCRDGKVSWIRRGVSFFMRLFIAINFNTETCTQLLALRDELRIRSQRGSFTAPENLHLTLVFLGECDEEQTTAVKKVMSTINFEPFSICIDRIGRFRRNGGDIWWAGVHENKQLLDLQRELSDKLIAAGFNLDKREYTPHITLGLRVMTKESPWTIRPFRETVSRIDLMKSERINGKLTYTAI